MPPHIPLNPSLLKPVSDIEAITAKMKAEARARFEEDMLRRQAMQDQQQQAVAQLMEEAARAQTYGFGRQGIAPEPPPLQSGHQVDLGYGGAPWQPSLGGAGRQAALNAAMGVGSRPQAPPPDEALARRLVDALPVTGFDTGRTDPFGGAVVADVVEYGAPGSDAWKQYIEAARAARGTGVKMPALTPYAGGSERPQVDYAAINARRDMRLADHDARRKAITARAAGDAQARRDRIGVREAGDPLSYLLTQAASGRDGALDVLDPQGGVERRKVEEVTRHNQASEANQATELARQEARDEWMRQYQSDQLGIERDRLAAETTEAQRRAKFEADMLQDKAERERLATALEALTAGGTMPMTPDQLAEVMRQYGPDGQGGAPAIPTAASPASLYRSPAPGASIPVQKDRYFADNTYEVPEAQRLIEAVLNTPDAQALEYLRNQQFTPEHLKAFAEFKPDEAYDDPTGYFFPNWLLWGEREGDFNRRQKLQSRASALLMALNGMAANAN